MVLKKMDALEFVNSLKGGWDCIIWDPPYLEGHIYTGVKAKFKKSSKKRLDIINRTKMDLDYQKELKEQIKEKTNAFVFIEFYNKIKNGYDDFFIWYKHNSGTVNGRNISNNIEFIYINYMNYKMVWKGYNINRGLWYKPKENHRSFEKPPELFEKLFQYFKIKYVLDPFGGSFNSAKACKKLGIAIDSCDKYLKPPDLIGLEKFGVN